MNRSSAPRSAQSGQQRQLATAHPNQALAAYFANHRDQVSAALPPHLEPERMLRLACTHINGSSKLRQSSPESVIEAVVKAAQLGLEIGVNGQAFLVPYKVDGKYRAQMVPGWQGLIDLVARAGKATAWTGCVYGGDAFDFELGSAPYLRHKPLGVRDPAALQFAYAIGQIKGADHPIIECWPIEQVWQHRDRFNRQGEDHYSFRFPEMYARKVVLLQVIKYLPKSVQLIDALDLTAADDGISALRGEFAVLDGDGETPQENDLAVVLEAIGDVGTAEELDALAAQIDALPSSQRKHAEAARASRAGSLAGSRE